MPVTIRGISGDDAELYIALLHQLDNETAFLLWEPDERVLDAKGFRESLRQIDQSQRITLVAAEDTAIVGFLVGVRGAQRRIRHRADLTMGVLQKAWGLGIGRRLLENFEEWARSQGVSRLELTVLANNDRAIRLYDRFGFVREGIKRRAIVSDGQVTDELVMGKLLA